MRRKINGEAYLIIKKNYTLIIRNSNSDPKITLLIEPTTITTYKFSFFLLRLSKHNFYPDLRFTEVVIISKTPKPDNQQESFSDKDTLPNDHLQTL